MIIVIFHRTLHASKCLKYPKKDKNSKGKYAKNTKHANILIAKHSKYSRSTQNVFMNW